MATKPTKELVEAWLYGILHPLIEGLEQEFYFLASQGNPTWRFRPQRCEFLRPLHEFVGREQHANLSQFLRHQSALNEHFVTHDNTLKELEAAAAASFAGLLQLPELAELTRKLDDEFKDWRGAYQQKDGPSLLAENIIDFSELTQLLSHYANAKAWEKYGPEAKRLRQDPRVERQVAGLDAAKKKLVGIVDTTLKQLQKLRDELADEYGLPAVRPAYGDTVDAF